MYLQIMSFDGPRGAEVLEASRRASIDRIEPLLRANPVTRDGLLGAFHGQGPDGAECHVILSRDAAALDEMQRLVMTSELLPGEDPALLSAPARMQRYEVTGTFGTIASAMKVVAR